MADLLVSQMETYVANRAGKGMNSLYFSAIACTGTGGNDESGTTYDAITPFTGGITSLRATYWARLDALVNLCERYGITVWLNLYDGWFMCCSAATRPATTSPTAHRSPRGI